MSPMLAATVALLVAGATISRVIPRAPGCSTRTAVTVTGLGMAGAAAFAYWTWSAASFANLHPVGDPFVMRIWLVYLAVGACCAGLLVLAASAVAVLGRPHRG
jgi:hypothetical protein